MIENIKQVIKIQAMFRGYITRKKRLPMIMYKIQKYLQEYNYKSCFTNNDGRINSCIDEEKIIKLLEHKFGNLIIKSKNVAGTMS